jgi:hypothetical protein
MSTDNVVTLIAAGLAFFASIIAIIISAYNARFTRFTSERWWERKAEAYNRIIGALSDLIYYYQQRYDAEFEPTELSEEKKQELADHWKKGFLEVRKATYVGTFMISPEAEAVLQQFWEEPAEKPHPDDWFSHLEIDYTKAETCLKRLVVCAKKDLYIRK